MRSRVYGKGKDGAWMHAACISVSVLNNVKVYAVKISESPEVLVRQRV